jgi:hypothetical protein
MVRRGQRLGALGRYRPRYRDNGVPVGRHSDTMAMMVAAYA